MCIGSLIFGFVSAIDTLVSQNFGKGDYEICGIHYNRCSLFAFLMALALSSLAAFSDYFLRWMGMNEINTVYTQQYVPILVIHTMLSPQVLRSPKVS
jgi:Na+-driven multidrug efflux pump